MERFKKFLQSIFKGSDTGIKQTTQAQKALDEAAADIRKTDLGEVSGKFDETTKPGEFKEQKPIIGPEGETQTQVFSYRPESFTETQRRQGVGGFSDDALTERYFDEGFDDTLSLEEFIIQERNITPEMRAAELRDKGRIQTIEPKQTGATFEEAADDLMISKIEPETISYITTIAKATRRNPKDVRQLIVDKMNEGYSPGDPKRVTIDDDARINAYIESQRTMDATGGFTQDLIDDVLENTSLMGETGNPVLDDLLRQERELIEQSSKQTEELKTIRARTDEVKEQLEAMGLDTSGVDFDIIKNSDDINAVRAEADKLRELMGSLMGGMEDLAKTGNLEKAMLSINDEVAADIARGKAALDNVTTPAEG